MIDKEEFWVPVRGYEGLYEISNLLNIRSLQRIVPRKDGFKKTVNAKKVLTDTGKCCLSKNNIHKTEYILSLAIESFYTWFNKNEWRYVRIPIDNAPSELYNYQIFKRHECNPVTVYMNNGFELRFNNVIDMAKAFNMSDISMMNLICDNNILSKELGINYLVFDYIFRHKENNIKIKYFTGSRSLKQLKKQRIAQQKLLLINERLHKIEKRLHRKTPNKNICKPCPYTLLNKGKVIPVYSPVFGLTKYISLGKSNYTHPTILKEKINLTGIKLLEYP